MEILAKIRIATLMDRPSIEEIYSSSTESRFLIADLEWTRWINNKGLLVAELNGQIVGFGGIDVNAKEQLKWLFLAPQFQGKGIGSKLLEQLEEIGWRYGLESIRLHSTPNAETFYQKAGYVRVTSDGQSSHDHDGVEMIKSRQHAVA